jgi:hypothetical protein
VHSVTLASPTPTKSNSDQPNGASLDLDKLPQTPIPRLSISDLMCPEEDKSDNQVDEWPEARVIWARSTPGGDSSRFLSHVETKRSASSSPPQVKTPSTKRNRGNISTEAIVDPATQLWDKYRAGVESASGQRPTNPAARLFDPDRVDRSPSALQRAHSAPDVLKPSSRYKRRKTSGLESLGSTNSSMATKGDEGSKIKGSLQARVVDLMEQVKQNMNRSVKTLPTQGSLPPLVDYREDVFSSPPIQITERFSSTQPTKGNEKLEGTEAVNSSDSEEFGEFDDADFDMDILDALERASSSMPSNNMTPSRIDRAVNPAIAPVVDETPGLDHFDDEFDDDFFSEDIEKIVAQYDAPTPHGEELGLGQRQIEDVGAT